MLIDICSSFLKIKFSITRTFYVEGQARDEIGKISREIGRDTARQSQREGKASVQRNEGKSVKNIVIKRSSQCTVGL